MIVTNERVGVVALKKRAVEVVESFLYRHNNPGIVRMQYFLCDYTHANPSDYIVGDTYLWL